MKRSITRRARYAVAAGVAVAVISVSVPMVPASAATPTGTSYSAAVKTGPGLLKPTITSTGLLSFLQPILNAVVNPLIQGVAAMPTEIVNAITNAILGKYKATTPTSSVSMPAGGAFPSCTSPGFSSVNCYNTGFSAGVPNLISFSASGPVGFTTADATAYSAKAQSYSSSLSAFGFNLFSNAGPTSGVSCPVTGTAGSPAATWTMATTSLLGGLITTQTASSSSSAPFSASMGGKTISTAPVGGTLGDANGTHFTATVTNQGLYVQLALNPGQLTTSSGLGSSFFADQGTSPVTAAIQLTIHIGPGGVTTTNSAEAWGLAIGLDLAFNFGFNIMGSGLYISAPSGLSGTNFGNLLDLKYAYTNCGTGTALPGATSAPTPTPTGTGGNNLPGSTPTPTPTSSPVATPVPTATPTGGATPTPAPGGTQWIPPNLN
ncbi:hypothetical protein SAMN05892883_3960 [Jatrophihabitans sp. GAS493]|uniref:hypothetical protein n=1 Tax=Jatrophihabitans sp. GAS493 TaxID=1907575 RepID=UPI000BBFC1D0|nr:hypothetical protein [Jatrophihabitans sp. GAS493]SOD74769.1 hypothetical protein SAMN05892883_3960 [Jatrophihabitans sp. GAS493]